MRFCHSQRSSISVCRSLTLERSSSMCSGGIHDFGTRPACSSSRNRRASWRSVLARFFGPRSALVSAGSARCTSAPTARSSSTMKRQPVVASSAASICSPSAGMLVAGYLRQAVYGDARKPPGVL
ncbi:MAG TPA: hypothetical protein VES79_13435 [Solirubrobacteraceae bacterium]|nr:hypothetical protein [Solirubrobacteraceae bacterium]